MDVKRAAVYARYSSDEQTGGESIEYQLERCREYVGKKSWSLDESNVFVDRARSGTSTYRREEFNRMVALTKQDKPSFDVVVVWSTSRFGRNMDECAVNKAFLRKQGVEVHFVSQPLPEGHVGKLIEKIFEWTDELQSIQIGEYAFQGQKQVTQKGFHGGGKAPYGYKRVRVPDPEGKCDKDGKVVEYVTYEVVEDQAKVVRRVFRMYAEGASYKQVAHTLNTEGIQSPRGSTWAVSGVRAVLVNESYRGDRVWNQVRRNKKVQRGTKVPKPRSEWVITKDAHPAIVDEDLWGAIQKRMDRNRQIYGRRGSFWTPHSPAMLTGLMQCGTCGANYHRNTIRSGKKVRHYYRCGYHSKRGNAVCGNGRSVNAATIEDAALNLLSKRLLTTENGDAVLRAVRSQQASVDDRQETGRLKNRIRKIEREIDNLARAIREGGPITRLVADLKDAEKTRADLLGVLTEGEQTSEQLPEIAEEDVRAAIGGLRVTLTYATPEEQKSLLREHIREIRVPEKGPALLETNPAGLIASLGVCEFLVTPRGVAMKERTNLIPFPEDQRPSVRLAV